MYFLFSSPAFVSPDVPVPQQLVALRALIPFSRDTPPVLISDTNPASFSLNLDMITIHPDHCAEISEVETAKVNSRKILGKAKIGKIDTRAEKN